MQYRNTFQYIENRLNNIKSKETIEVFTTYELVYNEQIYTPTIDFTPPNTISNFVKNYKKETRKVNKKIYNINTRTYKDKFTNINDDIEKNYQVLENYILKKDEKIFRNFLCNGITFKLNNRLLQVLVKQKYLTIVFPKFIKEVDIENRLYLRKGYEKDSLIYSLDIVNEDTLKYALELFDKEYEIIMDNTKEKNIDLLLNELINRINNIDIKIKNKTIKKGKVFYSTRNFAIIERKRYGLHVRLLNVDDSENVLTISKLQNDPLFKFYNVINKEDIDILIPFIIKSFELTKYCYFDVRNGLHKTYN